MSGQVKTKKESESVQGANPPTGTKNVKPCVKCGATDRTKRGDCRPCAKERHTKYRAENPDKEREKSVKYRALHPEVGAKYRAENREKIKAYKAKYRAENPEVNAKWRAENYEKCKEGRAKWWAENPEYNAKWRAENPEASARWKAKNPEKCKASDHKRRSRKIAAGGSFTAEEIRTMLKDQKGKCVVCKVKITDAYHIDHIIPLSLGGHNGIGNIQLLCPHCNLSKKDKHPVDFMQGRGFLL